MGIVNRRQCTKSTLNMSRLIQSANRVRLFESILLQYLAKKTDLNLRTLQKESTFSNYYLQFFKKQCTCQQKFLFTLLISKQLKNLHHFHDLFEL